MRTKLSGLLVCIALYFRAEALECGHRLRARRRNSLTLDHRLESVMDKLVRVRLIGGPEGAPVTWEVRSLEDNDRIRVLCGNRYEHFEYAHISIGGDDGVLPVYRWIYRTYVAE